MLNMVSDVKGDHSPRDRDHDQDLGIIKSETSLCYSNAGHRSLRFQKIFILANLKVNLTSQSKTITQLRFEKTFYSNISKAHWEPYNSSAVYKPGLHDIVSAA
jgi:hypothetical protein